MKTTIPWTTATRNLVAVAAAAAMTVVGCNLASYRLELRRLAVTPASPTVAMGTVQQLTATGRYEDDSERDVTGEAGWTSSNPAVATVSAAGLVTPAGAGSATVMATLEGVTASAVVTVSDAQLVSIEVTPATASIANGTRFRFSATGHFDDGSAQDLTSQVTWSSSESSVTFDATAGSEGLASSVELGAVAATVSASLDGISGEAVLTVRAVGLSAIAVTPATATITVGSAQHFAATGTFSDASTQDMTAEVAWESSSPSVATVSPSGRAAGVFAGTTTITATSSALLGSVSGAAELTVKSASGGY